MTLSNWELLERNLAGKHFCQDCGKSMADRFHTTIRCYACLAKKEAERAAKRHKEKPLQRIASSEVAVAVAAGKLPLASTLVCVDCGKPAKHYDHRDYTKPLDVVPVCISCNCKRGAAYPYQQETKQ